MLTALLVHGGFIHLGLNMLALWMVGQQLEPLLGVRSSSRCICERPRRIRRHGADRSGPAHVGASGRSSGCSSP
jgi:hypothetical protein